MQFQKMVIKSCGIKEKNNINKRKSKEAWNGARKLINVLKMYRDPLAVPIDTRKTIRN